MALVIYRLLRSHGWTGWAAAATRTADRAVMSMAALRALAHGPSGTVFSPKDALSIYLLSPERAAWMMLPAGAAFRLDRMQRCKYNRSIMTRTHELRRLIARPVQPPPGTGTARRTHHRVIPCA
ncbi:MAG: hypothetical protein BroJett029_14780 [Alphaproteobacteria bacterium]|nr:MAG: hypothetical protein BroJett029_14780 [Alphaproteobacteria bacterium]